MRFTSALMKSPVKYGLCLSRADFKRTLDRLGVDEDDSDFLGHSDVAMAHGFTTDDGRRHVIVAYRPTRKNILKIHADLIHEAVHIWQEIRSHIGEPKAGAEQEAYSIERIAYTLMRDYHKQTGRA